MVKSNLLEQQARARTGINSMKLIGKFSGRDQSETYWELC